MIWHQDTRGFPRRKPPGRDTAGARSNWQALCLPAGWGEHPIAPARFSVLTSRHDETTILPQPAVSRVTTGVAEPEPIRNSNPLERRRSRANYHSTSSSRGGHGALVPELETRLLSGVQRAAVVAPRSPKASRLDPGKERELKIQPRWRIGRSALVNPRRSLLQPPNVGPEPRVR